MEVILTLKHYKTKDLNLLIVCVVPTSHTLKAQPLFKGTRRIAHMSALEKKKLPVPSTVRTERCQVGALELKSTDLTTSMTLNTYKVAANGASVKSYFTKGTCPQDLWIDPKILVWL